MADHQDFTNGTQTFNISLESDGDLHFKANGEMATAKPGW